MGSPNRLLSIAAASGRVAYILFEGQKPQVWGLSKRASKSPELAKKFAERWIGETAPDAVVTEKIAATMKRNTTLLVIEAIQQTAADAELLDVSVARPWRYSNKYEEALTLRERYPELTEKLPVKRVFYNSEPRNTVFIDALVLAEEIFGPELDKENGDAAI